MPKNNWIYKQLAQAEATTSATSILSMTDKEMVIREIVVTNHENTASTYSIWLDDNGTTYDDTTVMTEDTPIPPNKMVPLRVNWGMSTKGGNLAVKAGANSKVTVTIFGDEAERGA